MEQIRQNIQLSDFTKIPFTLFKFVGIRLFKCNPNERKPLAEKFALIIVLIYLVSHYSLMTAILFHTKDMTLLELTEYACYQGFIVNGFLKMIFVWRGRFIFHGVYMEMNKIFPKTNREIYEYRLEENYKKFASYMRTISICHIATATMFSFFPICQSIVEYLLYGGDFAYVFPFIFWYPFDETQPFIYPVVYLLQTMGSFILSCFFLGTDLLLVSVVYYTCMYFDYLANQIECFEPNGTDEDVLKLKGFIEYHENLLRMSFNINEVFNIAILMNYLCSGLVICMVGFQITVGSEVLYLFKFFSFLISSLIHVYFISYFGTDLSEKSIAISDAVFSQKWYLGNAKYRKMLILIIARAHKPVYLTAFKFFVVSMESFKTLVTTSYQFFTLIRTKYEEA